jgi:hypothetical protein
MKTWKKETMGQGDKETRRWRGLHFLLVSLSPCLLVVLFGAAEWRGEAMQPRTRFEPVDVFVDSGQQPLAAYQVEIRATRGDVKIVGIEGGDGAAYGEPPFYDPAAMKGERVILAAYSLGDNLPAGKTRVARVHVQVTGDQRPEYAVRLVVAGNKQGQQIQAGLSIVEGEGK